ncbi:MAG: ChaB family protein [Acidobacteria bacterium]|nr:ChaB family protein [Acidobacteriota bacterium]MBV9478127.1 ChaB family protein [Acidobacteriota bacterium]
MYESIEDLPYVCRINLPEAALRVYREAFNRAWQHAAETKTRFRTAQTQAWSEVRSLFERDRETGRWMQRTMELKPRVQTDAPRQRSAQ